MSLGTIEEVKLGPLRNGDVEFSSHYRSREDAVARELNDPKAMNSFTRLPAYLKAVEQEVQSGF